MGNICTLIPLIFRDDQTHCSDSFAPGYTKERSRH